MDVTQSQRSLNEALERARAHSPFLSLQSRNFPDVGACLSEGDLDSAFAAAARAGQEAAGIMASLRRERGALALALAVGDLAGALAFETVVARLSAFADRAIDRALAAALAERDPDAEPAGFAVIALGKLGSAELNYSSDVDLILLFDPERLPRKPREEPGQAALRVGQRLVEILQKRDSDGYVFRTDLRLRPSPDVTPIALPVDAAISYYESSALAWERAAFIRARAVAGDSRVSGYFLDALHPFVWRRSLDFGAIGEIQSITRLIRGHYSHGQRLGPGFDLKRGRGGIREIEFFAQIHQLIHGGRDPALRAPATLDALAALSSAGRIAPDDADALAGAYRLFRTIEHRLQMVEDKQTHSLPIDEADLDNVARLHGLRNGDALVELLAPPIERVSALYDSLGGDGPARLPWDPEPLERRLAGAGFAEPADARLRVESWRSGRPRSLRAAAARDAFEAMLPGLVDAFGRAPDPMRAMNRFDDIVCRLPSGLNFYRLLEARPLLTEHVATILSHAPALADQLARRPELLDGLIDATAFAAPPATDALIEEFARSDREGEDYQLLLDKVRRRVNERRFALGAQLVLGRTDPIGAAEGYSRIAEAALNVLARAAVAEFEDSHGRVPGCELLILGLGRLGGEALTFASDLDLVYLFSGSHEAVSDGPKSLRATDYFNRLAPRVTAALSVPTAAGPLYEVDTRLRPSGTDGMLVVSLDSFAGYQRDQAWTWEHMALLRARPVFGSAEARDALRELIVETLSSPRDPRRTIADAVKMRREMAAHKPPRGTFDIKLGDGGLVDLEFAVHTLQLTTGKGLDPHLETALAALCLAGLVGADIDPALRLLTRMLVMFRLVSPNSAEPPEPTRPLVARACGHDSWDSLLEAHDAARQSIATLWRKVSEGG
jgi:glutamate-ammonia-ligase adenylyltransferase